jgi:hypothetical protein
MRRFHGLATTALLLLVLINPALAQRGQSRGEGGSRPGSDAQSRQAQPRDSASVVGRMLDTGRRNDTGVPTLPGLGSASLITPRPGVDAFRADPGTYGGRRDGSVRGPSWGGVPVLPAAPSWGGVTVGPSVPSWGGVPAHDGGRGKRDHDRDGRGHLGPRDKSWRHSRGLYTNGYAVLYGLPYGYAPYGIADSLTGQTSSPTVTTPAIPEGFLRLLVTPREATVIVDGIIVGTVDDFGGRGEQALPAGPHRIRIEAPGYEAVEFDVRVPAGDTISLRRELSPLPGPTEPAPQAPAAPKTFYAIPNCYLGDSIPKAEMLPKGCSLENMRVLPPQ